MLAHTRSPACSPACPAPSALAACAPCREVSLVALLGFLAYLIGEELQLSGIFSVFFCGITMRWGGGGRLL